MSEQRTYEHDGHDQHIEAANDTFLIAEGLELLAAYRAIPDKEVRASIRGLLQILARKKS